MARLLTNYYLQRPKQETVIQVLLHSVRCRLSSDIEQLSQLQLDTTNSPRQQLPENFSSIRSFKRFDSSLIPVVFVAHRRLVGRTSIPKMRAQISSKSHVFHVHVKINRVKIYIMYNRSDDGFGIQLYATEFFRKLNTCNINQSDTTDYMNRHPTN